MRQALAFLASLALVLAACGDTNGTAHPNRATTTTALVQEVSATSEVAEVVPEIWDLLYIQDSLGFGVADLYAERVVEELGVGVRVHNKAIGNLSAVTILDRIRDDWVELVRDAEIIVLFGNPRGSGYTSDVEICVSGSTVKREPPVHYSKADWEPYQNVLEQIYAEIWRVRDRDPLVLRALTFINPAISAWREAGIEPECTAALEAMNRGIAEAAETGGATLVSTYDLFNGLDHQEDPREKGWIGADGIHLSTDGMRAVAEALVAVGFEPTTATGD